MPVTLSEKPPKDRSKQFPTKYKTHNRIRTETNWKTDSATGQAIQMTVSRIEGMLKAFMNVATEGNLAIIVTSGTYQMEGELICYYTNHAPQRNEHLRKIDQAVFCLRGEFAPCIQKITFFFEQTCEFEY